FLHGQPLGILPLQEGIRPIGKDDSVGGTEGEIFKRNVERFSIRRAARDRALDSIRSKPQRALVVAQGERRLSLERDELEACAATVLIRPWRERDRPAAIW